MWTSQRTCDYNTSNTQGCISCTSSLLAAWTKKLYILNVFIKNIAAHRCHSVFKYCVFSFALEPLVSVSVFRIISLWSWEVLLINYHVCPRSVLWRHGQWGGKRSERHAALQDGLSVLWPKQLPSWGVSGRLSRSFLWLVILLLLFKIWFLSTVLNLDLWLLKTNFWTCRFIIIIIIYLYWNVSIKLFFCNDSYFHFLATCFSDARFLAVSQTEWLSVFMMLHMNHITVSITWLSCLFWWS